MARIPQNHPPVSARVRRWNGTCKVTHVLNERKTPALVLPGCFCNTFEADKEFTLEIQKFVKIGKEEVYSILIHVIALCECIGVFLWVQVRSTVGKLMRSLPAWSQDLVHICVRSRQSRG